MENIWRSKEQIIYWADGEEIEEWMYVWRDRWMDGWMTEEKIDRCLHGWLDKYTEELRIMLKGRNLWLKTLIDYVQIRKDERMNEKLNEWKVGEEEKVMEGELNLME